MSFPTHGSEGRTQPDPDISATIGVQKNENLEALPAINDSDVRKLDEI